MRRRRQANVAAKDCNVVEPRDAANPSRESKKKRGKHEEKKKMEPPFAGPFGEGLGRREERSRSSRKCTGVTKRGNRGAIGSPERIIRRNPVKGLVGQNPGGKGRKKENEVGVAEKKESCTSQKSGQKKKEKEKRKKGRGKSYEWARDKAAGRGGKKKKDLAKKDRDVWGSEWYHSGQNK